MANGILGTPTDLLQATNATVYEVPADTFAVVSVSICNRNANARQIRLAVSSTDSPTAAEFIEYDSLITGNGVLERTGIVMQAGKKIVAYANDVDVTAMVFGIETSTV